MIERNFWKEMRRFRNKMNNFFSYPEFEEDFDQTKPANYRRAWANFKQTENSFVIAVEIPGVSKEDIKVNILTDPKGIEIKAEKKKEAEREMPEDEEGVYSYRYAKAYAGFYRAINLPENADINNIDAEYKDGILRLTIGKLKSSIKNKKEVRVR